MVRSPLGFQRDWFWRGWRIRYTHLRPPQGHENPLPILFLHGFGANLEHWRSNLRPLAQHYPVYALDFLCFGGSQKAATRYGVQLWQEQVYDFWQTWIGEPIVLVGHSLGALVALSLAVQHPQLIDRLVLLTLPPTREEQLPPWAVPLVSTLEGLFASPLLLRPLFQWVRRPQFIRAGLRLAYADPQKVDGEVVRIYAEPPQDPEAARALCWLVRSSTRSGYSPAIGDLLPQLQVPTLLLWGTADRVVPFPRGQHLAQTYPYLKWFPLEGVGHCAYDEDPDRVNQAILDWIPNRP